MRLIDGDKLQEFPIRANRCDKEHANKHFLNGIETVLEYAEQLPTVDAEVVVRCKDCKHLVAVNVNGKGIPTCRMSGMEVAPAEFCSRGEKERRC